MTGRITVKKNMHDQKGVAAVEFAIILLPLVLLIFGSIEFTTALYDKAVITNASREGARAGIVYDDPRRSNSDIVDAVSRYCSDNMISLGGNSDISTQIIRGGDTAGDPLTVRVTYTYNFLVLPNFITSLAPGITMEAETVMRME
jgi:Flp pilus assembly protein TadG